MPARVFRISFSGEMAYEVNVPWGYGAALWEALWAAGQPFGITAYGTEAMHVLRAEKGYIIVGQDTDGTVTPFDLGMDWIVASRSRTSSASAGCSSPACARRTQAAGRPADRGSGRGSGGGRADRRHRRAGQTAQCR